MLCVCRHVWCALTTHTVIIGGVCERFPSLQNDKGRTSEGISRVSQIATRFQLSKVRSCYLVWCRNFWANSPRQIQSLRVSRNDYLFISSKVAIFALLLSLLTRITQIFCCIQHANLTATASHFEMHPLPPLVCCTPCGWREVHFSITQAQTRRRPSIVDKNRRFGCMHVLLRWHMMCTCEAPDSASPLRTSTLCEYESASNDISRDAESGASCMYVRL